MVGMESQKTLDNLHLLPRLVSAGVTLTTQQNLRAVEGRDVVTGFIWGGPERRVRDVDTIIVAMLREPVDTLYHALDGRIAERQLLVDAPLLRLLLGALPRRGGRGGSVGGRLRGA